MADGIRTAPCDWPVILRDCAALDELDEAGEAGEGPAELTAADVIEAATAYLWTWTGKVYGLCPVTVRPCRADCPEFTTYRGAGHPDPLLPTYGWGPALVGGVWRNVRCGVCRGDGCSCDTVEAIELPGPIHSIDQIRIDGEVLDPSAYRVDDRRRLVRDDGEGWPDCQDLGKPAGEPGTWTVTYRWGVPVPKGGQIAAGVLACQLAKALRGDSSCELPQRVQTVTREGVTVGILDPFEGLEGGRTGLWVVDSWVASVTQAPARSTVHSPDARRRPPVTTYRGAP